MDVEEESISKHDYYDNCLEKAEKRWIRMEVVASIQRLCPEPCCKI